jgi:fatty acid desaturase
MHALRGIVEHRRGDAAEVHVNDAALRNFRDGFVERWVFGPYGFVEHATHHRYPGIPYYQLPAVTEARRGTYQDLEPVGSHLSVLGRLVGVSAR